MFSFERCLLRSTNILLYSKVTNNYVKVDGSYSEALKKASRNQNSLTLGPPLARDLRDNHGYRGYVLFSKSLNVSKILECEL